MQDIISLGIDISSFNSQKEETLNKFIYLFNQLEKMDGKVISPVLGTGLAEFNKTITETSAILKDINDKLNALTGTNQNVTNTTKGTTKAVKELNAEQAKQKVQAQESNRIMMDNARAQNTLAQQRAADAAAKRKDAEDEKKRIKDIADKKRQAARDELRDIREARRAKVDKAIADRDAARATRDEANATKYLTDELRILKDRQAQQGKDYANAFIAEGGKKGRGESPQSKMLLAEYEATSTVINKIEGNLAKAGSTANKFGRVLNDAFSQVRTLAYILPGLGIAGIFNIAFEAIGKAADELGVFNSRADQLLEYQKSLNSLLLEQIKLNEKLFDTNKELNTQTDGRLSRSQMLDINTARGIDPGNALQQKLNTNRLDLDKTTAEIMARGLSPESLKSDLNNRLTVIRTYTDQIEALDKKIVARLDPRKKAQDPKRRGDIQFDSKNMGASTEQLQAQKEVLKGKKDLLEQGYKTDEAYLQKFSDLQAEYFKLDAERVKFNEDEKRREYTETQKARLDAQIDTSQAILNDEINTQKQKQAALKSIRNDQLAGVDVELNNVLSDRTVGLADRNIAIQKAASDRIKIQTSYNEKLINLNDDYRMRYLKAQEGIDKALFNQVAVANEKVFNNEQKSLKERLAAYNEYIKQRQAMQNLEFNLSIETRRLKSSDPSAKKEIEELRGQREEQKANIQADAEAKVYEIIRDSIQKQLNLITEGNQVEEKKYTAQYARELEIVNKSFEDKKISYKKYRAERNRIDVDFGRASLDAQIRDDKEEIEQLRKFLLEQIKLKQQAEEELESAKIAKSFVETEGGTESEKLSATKRVDEAQGAVNAFTEVIGNTEVQLGKSKEELEADRLKRAKIMMEEDINNRKNWAKAIGQIEESLYRTIKRVSDENYRQRHEANKLIFDEQMRQIDAEADAIDDSSLSAKNKAALDIQLAAEKQQRQENFAREERKLKHDQAVFDRNLAIAHIIFNTAEAVTALLEVPPLAIAAGVAGAAELVVASQVDIPSYAEGTGQKPHPGGYARTGEDGVEIIKEPYKVPYLVFRENISYLPKGTDVIPIQDDLDMSTAPKADGWDQIRWLAKKLKPKQTATNVTNNIIIDLGFETYKAKKLFGRYE